MNAELQARRRSLHPEAVGDHHAATLETAHELIGLYRTLLHAPGTRADELEAAREAAHRWCRRAGLVLTDELLKLRRPAK